MGVLCRLVVLFFVSSALVQAGKFRTLAFSPEVTISECLLQVGEGTQPIDLPRMNLSKSYDLPADRNLVFGQKTYKVLLLVVRLGMCNYLLTKIIQIKLNPLQRPVVHCSRTTPQHPTASIHHPRVHPVTNGCSVAV